MMLLGGGGLHDVEASASLHASKVKLFQEDNKNKEGMF